MHHGFVHQKLNKIMIYQVWISVQLVLSHRAGQNIFYDILYGKVIIHIKNLQILTFGILRICPKELALNVSMDIFMSIVSPL
jgi:hypothetical protein